MTKNNILKLFLSLAVVFTISGGTVFAQSTSSLPISICTSLTQNMSMGARDSFTSGDVTRLQSYLNTNGYLSVSATGYFGPMTLRAVQKFQIDNGLYPAGFVGPLTRAKINSLICGVQTSSPVIYSISPTSGVVGSQVTINGGNFTSDSKVSFNSGYANTVVVSNNAITFTVPYSLEPKCFYTIPRCYTLVAGRFVLPGAYSVSVSNSNGTSNIVNFNVISNTGTNNAPVINGLDAPTDLSVDETGTWTIHATDSTGGGLRYSVVWGDEASIVTTTNTTSATPSYNNQTSTFTHSYHSSGTYTPVFTVTGSNGQSVQTSASVTISGTTQTPMINYLNPTSGRVNSTITVYGSGFSNTNTVLFDGGPVNNITSYNGTSLSFTVPEYVGVDCAQNMYCPMIARQITLGSHPVVVRSSNGTSNTVYFTVTN